MTDLPLTRPTSERWARSTVDYHAHLLLPEGDHPPGVLKAHCGTLLLTNVTQAAEPLPGLNCAQCKLIFLMDSNAWGTRVMNDAAPVLAMWTVYHEDERHHAREWVITGDRDPRLTGTFIVGTVERIREHLTERGLTRLSRSPDDHPSIVETWL